MTPEANGQQGNGNRRPMSDHEYLRKLDADLDREKAKQEVVLALSQEPNYSKAATRAGITRRTIRLWRDKDPEFDEACQDAIMGAMYDLEGSLFQRGCHGIEKGVYYQGERVAVERVYDTPAAMFLLRGHMPERYSEKFRVDGEVNVNANINIHQESIMLLKAIIIDMTSMGWEPDRILKALKDKGVPDSDIEMVIASDNSTAPE